MTNDDLAETKKALKRKAETENTEAAKQQKIANLELMETLKRRLKSKVDAANNAGEKGDDATAPGEDGSGDPDGTKKGKKAFQLKRGDRSAWRSNVKKPWSVC